MLPVALLALLLVEMAAAIALGLAAGEARLVTDRRLVAEAVLAVESAAGQARVAHDSVIARLAPGERIALAVPPVASWRTSAVAARPDNAPLAALTVTVWRDDPRGGVLVQRRLTLLLSIESADTALVLDRRPGG